MHISEELELKGGFIAIKDIASDEDYVDNNS